MDKFSAVHFLPIVILLAIGALLFFFWWPMRRESYGKSLPLFIVLGVILYFFGFLINPTLTFYLSKMAKSGLATLEHLSQIKIFWTICENLFTVTTLLLILSDVANLLPEAVRKSSRLYSFLGQVYKNILPVGILLLLLQVLPAAVLYYFIVSKTGFWKLTH